MAFGAVAQDPIAGPSYPYVNNIGLLTTNTAGQFSPTYLGAVGNAATDNTAYFTALTNVPFYLKDYWATNYPPVSGQATSRDGVVENPVTGRVYNPRAEDYQRIGNVVALEHWFRLFKDSAYQTTSGHFATAKTIVCSGDSTTYGVNGTANYILSSALKLLANERGYEYVNSINRGQSGKTTLDWQTNYVTGDIAAAPDLLILRWGANDPYYLVTNGTPVTSIPAIFLQRLRAGLAIVRASNSVQQTSILLCTPGPMNDIYFGRSEYYFDAIREGIKQAARDYQCAYLDTFSLFSNAHDGVGYWMDSDSSSGTARGIHPGDILYGQFANAIADVVFPLGYAQLRTSGFYNRSASDSSANITPSTTPGTTNLPVGLSINRMTGAGTSNYQGPNDGMAYTFTGADGTVLQLNHGLPGTTTANGLNMRWGFNGNWSPWSGAKLSFQTNSYYSAQFHDAYFGTNGPSGRIATGLSVVYENGVARLYGVATDSGSTYPNMFADGSVIGTVPSGYYPASPGTIIHAMARYNTTDTPVAINVGANGQLKLYSWPASSTNSAFYPQLIFSGEGWLVP